MAQYNSSNNAFLASNRSIHETVMVVGANGSPVSESTPIDVSAQSTRNIISKFREAFETYDTTRWNESKASGDLIFIDGNAVAASYLVISKDPLTADTVSTIESTTTFSMPFELAVGLHTSQRTYGQELAIEVISAETPGATIADLAISSIQQVGTTLTVSTALPHGLRPGMRIGIRNVTNDSRLNYSALVVASAPSTTQFTATAGPQGTIATLTSGPFSAGYVYVRPAMSHAPNGTSLILENANGVNGSIYARSESGDVLPSGTIIGNHSTAIASTASVQAINAALTYAFQPTSEYRLSQMLESIQWHDAAVDSVNQTSSRRKITQVVPNTTALYRLRLRSSNLPSLSVPVARIVSAVKSGGTTATVTTDVAHGLTTGDYVTIHGNRDTTNFANITTATVVASTPNSTTFTIVWGSAVTATGYGGFVSRINGQQLVPGVASSVVQSASRTSNTVALTGSATWVGATSIGDLVNLHGCRNATNGDDVGIDGSYRVRDIQTTVLYLEPIGSAPTGVDIVSTNCGGSIIRRTDIRVSYIRIMDFDRLRVEMMARPTGDTSQAVPIVVNGGSLSAAVTAISAGNVAIGDVGVQLRSTGGTALLISRLLSAAGTTNATSVKGSAGKLATITGYNAAASVRYLKLYNKASAPTVGTDTPVATIALAPSKEFWLDWSAWGLIFATGIAYAITTGPADNDTGACTAADVVGMNVYYV